MEEKKYEQYQFWSIRIIVGLGLMLLPGPFISAFTGNSFWGISSLIMIGVWFFSLIYFVIQMSKLESILFERYSQIGEVEKVSVESLSEGRFRMIFNLKKDEQIIKERIMLNTRDIRWANTIQEGDSIQFSHFKEILYFPRTKTRIYLKRW